MWKEGGSTIPDSQTKGNLTLKDVHFTYPTKAGVIALKGINIEIKEDGNRFIALVGESGSGKSTVVQMMERFYDPQQGQVLFNGKDVRDLENNWYRRMVSIVQQEPRLFEGTVAENIFYGMDEVKTMSKDVRISMLDSVTKKANCYDFLHDKKLFPDGYET